MAQVGWATCCPPILPGDPRGQQVAHPAGRKPYNRGICAAGGRMRQGNSMRFDWSTLGARAPATLVKARTLAHHAAQWPTRAARANLEAAPDDSHSSLTWDGERGALISQALPADGANVRVGLRIGLNMAGPALIILRGDIALDTYELAGRRDSMVGVWLDSALRALGLKPASGVTLPHTIPSHPVARGSAYNFAGESDAFLELAQWLNVATDLLEAVRLACVDAQPDAHAPRCWPHHFDIATLLTLDAVDSATARSIGIGVSLGDHYYAQPYVYVSPSPPPDATQLPALLRPGHWHTQGFVGAVATADNILALAERRADTLALVRSACEFAGARWEAGASDAGHEHENPLASESQ
jgi:hypothetical protein